MAYSVDIIYSKNQDLSNPQTETESGKPASVTLENLDSNSTYYTKAVLMVDGTAEAESTVSNFTTLQAGTIILTHVSTTSSGGNYVVTYTCSSTYALSSAILSCNSTNFQGVISGNSIVFTVTGLQTGAYLYTVTATDIYTETGTANGTIVANNYSSQYFTVKNVSNENITVSVKCTGTSSDSAVVGVSTDGTNWTTTRIYGNSTSQVGTLNGGEILMMKRTDSNWRPITITASSDFEVYGNISSLRFGDNFNTGAKSMTSNMYSSLFYGSTNLISAQNLYLGDYTEVGQQSLADMFRNCTSLTTPPDMSNFTLVSANNGMQHMFYGCTSMATPPDLSGISGSISENGMYEMFRNCTSLTTPPDLSGITSVGYGSLKSIFQNCTSLTTPPDLSGITSVGSYGLENMFWGCGSLTSSPDLSGITSVGDYGMQHMFNECIGLLTTPDLSGITSVGNYGMYQMFYHCTSLTTGADITSVTTLGTAALYQMYNYCSNLTTAYSPTVSWNTSKANDWLYGVASSGELYANPSIIASIPNNNTSGCPTNWYKHGVGQPEYMCFTDVSGSSNTLTLTKNGSAPTVSLEYSTDTSNWTTWTESNGVRTYTIPANGNVYLRGDNSEFNQQTDTNTNRFSISGNVNCLGNIMSIIDKTVVSTTLPEGAFNMLFKGATKLKRAPNLNLTSLNEKSLANMFDGCSGLVYAGGMRLMATTVPQACCATMFKDCTSLTAPPVFTQSPISLTGSSSFRYMFYGCSALPETPELNVVSLDPSGTTHMQSMFYNCTSLTDASNVHLNATTITTSAYKNMFYGCTSLTTTPAITSSALTVVENGMNSMFYNCSNLVNAPSLTISSVNGDGACNCMFYGCSKLTGVNGLKLNATSLPNGAYKQMFRGCSELVTPPEIMATTLSDGSGNTDNGSLAYMFYNCVKLNQIKVHFTNWNSGNYTKSWTYGTKSSGTFYKPSSLPATKNASGNTTNPNYIPYNWTVTNL